MKRAKIILSTILIGGMMTSFATGAFASTGPNTSGSHAAPYVAENKGNTQDWLKTCVDKGIIPQETADKVTKGFTENKIPEDKESRTAYLDKLVKEKTISQDQANKIKKQLPQTDAASQTTEAKKFFNYLVDKKIINQDQVNKIFNYGKQNKITITLKAVDQRLCNNLVKSKTITQRQATQIQKELAAWNIKISK